MPERSALPVQTPLNLVMPIQDGERDKLIGVLAGLSQSQSNPLRQALQALGNVHFAQFVFLEKGTRLGVFTIYDGDFDDYILSFVEHIGNVFNAVLQHIGDGGADLVPVQEHRGDFLRFIRTHDLSGLGQFSAYPGRRAFDIQQALEETVC
jgi:hypothetical protein